MKAKINFKIAFFLGLILILFYSCEKESKVEAPLPFGPSSFTVLLNVSPSPNVLTTGTTRKESTITTTLRKYDSSSQTYSAVAGVTIIFEICDAAGNPINAGYFAGNVSVIEAVTNASGVARLTYYSPLTVELATDSIFVYIWATIAGEVFKHESAPILIISGP